jgi:hypothetical protein
MDHTKKILYPVAAPSNFNWMFFCPGCQNCHGVTTTPDRNPGGPCWTFNENTERPTFSPSILVRGTKDITEEQHQAIMAGKSITPTPFVCHSFVTDGKIIFLPDCTHALAGKTVPMEAF